MAAQPAAPDEMVRAARRDQGPEPRSVPEHAEMGELVDHDRLERLRRREDEPPAEHQAALPGGAAPAASRIANGDRGGSDAEGRRVVLHRRIDRDPGLVPQPSLQDLGHARAIASGERHAQLEPLRRHDPGDRRATGKPRTWRGDPRGGRCDPQAMELAPEAERGAVGEAAPGCQLGALARPSIQVAADPRLAFPQERLDPRLGMGPAPTVSGRDRDDEPELGVDRDPEVAGPSRVAENVVERRAAQRDRPSRRVATALSIRRWRVSGLFAPSIGSTQNRWRL
jgi:hypothetical protein